MRLSFITFALCGALLVSSCSNIFEPEKPLNHDTYDALKDKLCDRQVVLLGEGGSHDEGATIEFKSQLARVLIEDCGFSLLVFESSFYQFVDLNRDISAGRQVLREDIEASIGWLWRDQKDIEPLLEILPDAVNEKRLKIAGMDDQSGGRGQDYANFDLPVELTESIKSNQQTKCREALNARITYSFAKEAPYDLAKKRFILSCLEASVENEDLQLMAMRKSLLRSFQRDHTDRGARLKGRGSSMYENFEYWYDREGQPKTIIWSATIHAAKNGSVIPAFGQAPNTGELVQDRFGDDSFVLGFSALSGTRGRPNRDVTTLPKASDDAIESLVFKNAEDDIVFLDKTALSAFGTAPALAIGNKYETRDWATLIDGLVIFRAQRPQTLLLIPAE